MKEFKPFEKIPRWTHEQHIVVTEKIDGTNAQICINEECTELRCGSRTRWITPDDDNFGFARWAHDNKSSLLRLGKGQHFGEWFGSGIQRTYGLKDKRLVLFNILRWSSPEQQERIKDIPVGLVPVLYQGGDLSMIETMMDDLKKNGSRVAPGYDHPEGIIIYQPQFRQLSKYTYDNRHKGIQERFKT